jgi:hypothetical protein
LRDTYGDDFAPGVRSDMKLSNLLKRADVDSLSQFRKKVLNGQDGAQKRADRRVP